MSDNKKSSDYELYVKMCTDQYESAIDRFPYRDDPIYSFYDEEENNELKNTEKNKLKNEVKNNLKEIIDIVWSSRAIEPKKDIGDDEIFFEASIQGNMRAFLNTLCETGAVKYKDGEDALFFYNPEKVEGEQDRYTLGELENLRKNNVAEHTKLMKKLQPLANVEPTERYSHYINCGDLMDRGKQSEQMIHMINYLGKLCKNKDIEPAKLIMGNHELSYLCNDDKSYGSYVDWENGGNCLYGNFKINGKKSIYFEKAKSLERAVQKAVASGALILAHSEGTTIFSHTVITKDMVNSLAEALRDLRQDMRQEESRARETAWWKCLNFDFDSERGINWSTKPPEQIEELTAEQIEKNRMEAIHMIEEAKSKLVEEISLDRALTKLEQERDLERQLRRLRKVKEEQEGYLHRQKKELERALNELRKNMSQNKFLGLIMDIRAHGGSAEDMELEKALDELGKNMSQNKFLGLIMDRKANGESVEDMELEKTLNELTKLRKLDNVIDKALDKLGLEKMDFGLLGAYKSELTMEEVDKVTKTFTELGDKIEDGRPFDVNDAKKLVEGLNELGSMKPKIHKDFTRPSFGYRNIQDDDDMKHQQTLLRLIGSDYRYPIYEDDLIPGLKYIVGHNPARDFRKGRYEKQRYSNNIELSEDYDNKVILAGRARSVEYDEEDVTEVNYAVAKPKFLLGEKFTGIPKTEKKQIAKEDSAKEAEKVYSKYMSQNLTAKQENIANRPRKSYGKYQEYESVDKKSRQHQLLGKRQSFSTENIKGGL
ncbi:MAG: hypothetical protein LBP39_01445 [Rickettsiales bacterium]|jgi:hypothetical protein|nr:hypothetical protein [Rickettsiales bacterium]